MIRLQFTRETERGRETGLGNTEGLRMGEGCLATRDATSIPNDTLTLLGDPPLLSTEDPKAYAGLISQVARAARPRHMLEWIWVREFVDLTWEAQRLRRYKTMLIERERQNRITAIQNERNDPYSYYSLATGKTEEIKPKRRQKKPRIAELNTERGSLSSFQGSLSEYERVEKLLGSIELKRHMLLHDAPFYREGLAHFLKEAGDNVIDAEINASPPEPVPDRRS
jgi:hypothetical protein